MRAERVLDARPVEYRDGMRMAFVLGAAALFLTACGPITIDIPVVTGPDGAGWVPVYCADHTDCIAKAGFLCKGGYRVDGNTAHTNSSFRFGGPVYPGFASNVTYHESMLVQCNSCEVVTHVLADRDRGTWTHDTAHTETTPLCRTPTAPVSPAGPVSPSGPVSPTPSPLTAPSPPEPPQAPSSPRAPLPVPL